MTKKRRGKNKRLVMPCGVRVRRATKLLAPLIRVPSRDTTRARGWRCPCEEAFTITERPSPGDPFCKEEHVLCEGMYDSGGK